MLSQLRAYHMHVAPMVGCFAHCSALELECMAFTVIRHLEDFQQGKFGHDGSTAYWFTNVAEFAG